MNENERKFFLRRFFSFNVPASLASGGGGSNNASFDEGNEVEHLKLTNLNEDLTKHELGELNIKHEVPANEFNYMIETSNPNPVETAKKIDSTNTVGDAKKKSLKLTIAEHHLDYLENEKLIKENDKKIDFGTMSRRKNFKKSTDSSKYLLTSSNNLISASNTFDLTSGVPGVDTTQPLFEFKNQTTLINLNESLKADRLSPHMHLELGNKNNKIQSQSSIELKPFKKKGVQIVTDTSEAGVKTPLLLDTLNLGDSKPQVLVENLPYLPTDLKLNTNHHILNYPSIEFNAPNLPCKLIKYRLV